MKISGDCTEACQGACLVLASAIFDRPSTDALEPCHAFSSETFKRGHFTRICAGLRRTIGATSDIIHADSIYRLSSILSTKEYSALVKFQCCVNSGTSIEMNTLSENIDKNLAVKKDNAIKELEIIATSHGFDLFEIVTSSVKPNNDYCSDTIFQSMNYPDNSCVVWLPKRASKDQGRTHSQ